jgi:hypothetical protein
MNGVVPCATVVRTVCADGSAANSPPRSRPSAPGPGSVSGHAARGPSRRALYPSSVPRFSSGSIVVGERVGEGVRRDVWVGGGGKCDGAVTNEGDDDARSRVGRVAASKQ